MLAWKIKVNLQRRQSDFQVSMGSGACVQQRRMQPLLARACAAARAAAQGRGALSVISSRRSAMLAWRIKVDH